VGPLLLVEVGDDLDVAQRAEVMAAGDQRVAQRRAVVYLPVADDLHRAVLVAERLLPTGDVDDREPAHAERRLGVRDTAEVVRPTMDHDVAHAAHTVGARLLAESEPELTCDAAHRAFSGRQAVADEA